MDSPIDRRDGGGFSTGFIWLLIGNMLCGIWLDYMIESKHEYVLSVSWYV